VARVWCFVSVVVGFVRTDLGVAGSVLDFLKILLSVAAALVARNVSLRIVVFVRTEVFGACVYRGRVFFEALNE